MRAVLFGAVLVGLVVGAVVVAARVFSDGGDAEPAVAVTPTVEADSPRGVASAFAESWSAGDIPSLYRSVHPEVLATVSQDALAAAYDSFAAGVTLTGLDAQVTDASEQAASVAVRASTSYFGVLEYTVNVPLRRDAAGALRVVWDTTVIHPELTAGRRFIAEVQEPTRGAIYDRNGSALAITTEARMLGLNRAVIGDPAAIARAVVEVGLTQAQLDAALNSPLPSNQRVAVGPVADQYAERAAVLQSTLPGILVYFETRRVHPLGAAAAHVVGYTRELTAEELASRAGEGYTIGDRVGAVGIEAGMDAVLAGKPGGQLLLVESTGATVRVVATREFIAGQDVHTTLDGSILVATYERLGSLHGAAVVLEPGSNAILALNSSPAYDPDAFERGDIAAINAILATPGDPLNNRATVGLYSAGSTFKLITGAAGMVHLGLGPTDTLPCTALWTAVNPPLRNWEGDRGPLTIAEALGRSCNPVFYEIGLRMNANTDAGLSAVARQFGFGAPTGVVGFAEEDGLVPDPQWKQRERGESWFAGDDINLAIGQGDLLVTPLQLANAYSAFIANTLRTPVVLQSETSIAKGPLPLAPEQHAHLLQGLKLVTGSGGTAAASFAGYRGFAGKSGTAEDAGEQQHVLFVAFAPADAPLALAAVVLDDGESGSLEAGPVARDIVLSAFQ